MEAKTKLHNLHLGHCGIVLHLHTYKLVEIYYKPTWLFKAAAVGLLSVIPVILEYVPHTSLCLAWVQSSCLTPSPSPISLSL